MPRTLKQAVDAVHDTKLSLRKALLQFVVPKSTLSLYVNGKVMFGSRCGPTLTQEEEKQLVESATHLGHIGYGCTHEQILDIVAKIVEKNGRPNPFINGRPG